MQLDPMRLLPGEHEDGGESVAGLIKFCTRQLVKKLLVFASFCIPQ